jgi:hypothetical protein
MQTTDDGQPVRPLSKHGSGVCGHLSYVFALEIAKGDYLEANDRPAALRLLTRFDRCLDMGARTIREPYHQERRHADHSPELRSTQSDCEVSSPGKSENLLFCLKSGAGRVEEQKRQADHRNKTLE